MTTVGGIVHFRGLDSKSTKGPGVESEFSCRGRIYRVGKYIGRGAHKIVHSARLLEGVGEVAVIYARSQGSPLKKEVAALNLCQGIPGIAQKIGSPVVVKDGWVRMVTDLCEEGDFVQWSQGKSRRERLAVLLDVANTLKVLHGRYFGHRDIKSANIGVKKDEFGRPHGMLIDCELLVDEKNGAKELLEDGAMSAAYFPPCGDQLGTQDSVPSTPSQRDVYALGATLFEACQPQVVHGGLCLNIVARFNRSAFPPIYLRNTKMSEIQAVIEGKIMIEPIRGLLLSMLQTNPKNRCSIDHVVEKMEEILQLPLPELDEVPAVACYDKRAVSSFSPSSSCDSPNGDSPIIKPLAPPPSY